MRHRAFIEKMTLEEKAVFLTGKNVWETREFPQYKIPSCFFADGPHGIRKQAGAADHLGLNKSLPATCFPTASTVANSWDITLCEEIGNALGKEANQQDVDVLLGPGLNIKRSPLCGRNFEYFSEDPYLSGKLAAAYVRGIQNQGVSACPKHFAVNNQEFCRMSSNSVLDERTLREIYLTGFEIMVIESSPKAIMSSYNQINGVYAHENAYLLKDILRDEWGFTGAVISDWGGSNDCVESAKNGGTLEMPSTGGDSSRQLIHAVKEGLLSEAEIDQRVDELLELVLFREGNTGKLAANPDLLQENDSLARKAALSSAVLLKNDEGLLPLEPDKKVALIGSFAEEPRYQGAGSSIVNPTSVKTAAENILSSGLKLSGFSTGFKRNGGRDDSLKQEAVLLAEKAETVLLYLGLDEMSESEGIDREHMRLPANQVELLSELSAVNPNIVVVLSAGSPVEMDWEKYCKGIIYAGLCGQAGAGAILDILTGKESPEGRLAETYPIHLEDTPTYDCFPGREKIVEYREGLYIGYRYYEKAKVPLAYPFGYGLSYTRFEYSNLEVDSKSVSFVLSNIGDRDGTEVAQLYIGCKESYIHRPVKELKGFKKVFLRAGESKKVKILLDDKAFRYYNTDKGRWDTEQGRYDIMIGSNISAIHLTKEIYIEGSQKQQDKRDVLTSYDTGNVKQVSDREFSFLLGHEIPGRIQRKELGINDTINQMHYAKSALARLLHFIIKSIKTKKDASGNPDLNIIFIYHMPFRAIAKMTGGRISMDMVEGMLSIINGSFFSGIFKVLSGYFENHRENKKLYKRLKESGKGRYNGDNSQ